MSFLAFFEQLAESPWSVALHESEIAYSIIESVHVWSLCLFFGMTVMFDLRLLGWTLRGVPVSEVIRRLQPWTDRKSTRLNSSHSQISYAVFCLKKKKNK